MKIKKKEAENAEQSGARDVE
jgi:hypothetical protein